MESQVSVIRPRWRISARNGALATPFAKFTPPPPPVTGARNEWLSHFLTFGLWWFSLLPLVFTWQRPNSSDWRIYRIHRTVVHIVCLSFYFLSGHLVVPRLEFVQQRHATPFFRAGAAALVQVGAEAGRGEYAR